MVLSSCVKDPNKTAYDGMDRDEKVLYVFRRSLITNIPWVSFTLVLVFFPFFAWPYVSGFLTLPINFEMVITLFWYLFVFGYAFHNFTLWFFNVYIVSSKKIIDIDFHGLLYKDISEATLDNIEDVTSVVKGTFGTIFNIGAVYVQTAGESREFEFTGVDRPAKIRDLIADLKADYRKRYSGGRGSSKDAATKSTKSTKPKSGKGGSK
jgi:hypothetical protein